MNEYIIEDAPQESTPDMLLRNLKSAGQRVGQTAEFLGTLPFELPAYSQDLYKYFTGEESPIQKSLRSAGMPIEHRERYFQPEPARGFGEEVAQQTLADLPFLIATGGLSGLGKIGLSNPIARTLLGNVAGETAKEFGAGALGQTGARIASDVLHGKITRPSLAQRSTAAYKPVKKLGDYGKVAKPEKFNEGIKLLENAYDVAAKPEHKNLLKHVYDSIQTASSGDKLDLRKLFDVRTELGKVYKDLKNAKHESLANDLRQGINEALRGAESKIVNPKFWNAISEGDKFKIADNVRTSVSDYIESQINQLPQLPAKIEKSLNLVTGLLRQPEKFVRYFGNPVFQKQYMDIAFRRSEGGPRDILKHINRLAEPISRESSQESEWIIE